MIVLLGLAAALYARSALAPVRDVVLLRSERESGRADRGIRPRHPGRDGRTSHRFEAPWLTAPDRWASASSSCLVDSWVLDEMSGLYRWVGLPCAVLAASAAHPVRLAVRELAVARGLASAPFAGLGRVSYSLYLWHSVPLAVNWTWSSGLGLPLYLLVSLGFVTRHDGAERALPRAPSRLVLRPADSAIDTGSPSVGAARGLTPPTRSGRRA